jgi:hypothetical protein
MVLLLKFKNAQSYPISFYTAGVGLAIKNPLASIFRYRHAQKILASEILKNDFGAEL